jgi:hypothetical protein
MHLKTSAFFWALALVCCAATSSQASTYSDAILADGPLAYWRLGDSASPAVDLTGNGHNGVAGAGVVFNQPSLLGSDTADKSINTGGDRIVVPGFEKLIGGTGYTAEYWIEPNAYPTACCTNVLGDGESGGDFFFMNYLLANGKIRPHFGAGPNVVALDSNASLAVGQTYHVATTWDNVTGVGNIYINGVLDRTAAIGTALPGAGGAGDNQIFIGRDNREGGGNLILDDVAFYNKPLSAAQVANHYSLAAPVAPTTVSLSTNVLNNGSSAGMTFGDNYNNNGSTSTVELVRFIPNPAPATSAPPVTYNQAGATIDLSAYVVSGATGGILGSNQHGRGSVLFLPGDGETPATNNGGFGIGAHANWLVTFDLNDIRTAHLAGTTQPLQLTGRFGMNGHGGPGEVVQPGNFVQGLVYLDGVQLFDSTPKSVSDLSALLNLTLPSSGRYLTLAIVNGANTVFDDGSFRDVNLTVVPEPSSLALAAVGLLALAGVYRRRKS